MTETATVPRASRRQWWGLAVLCLPTMLVMLDLNVVILALPHLSAALDASHVQGLWITDIYGFLIAGFLVTMGRLGDRIGRRRLLLLGATAFGLLSLAAAYATSPEMLIALRGLLGIAGATIMPLTLALIRNMFQDPKQMGTAMGVWSTAMMAGISLGPVVGGVLLNSFWWGSVFLIAIPVMLVLLLTGPVLLSESRSPAAGRLDLVSVALSLAAILPVIYGLKELARGGWAGGPVAAVLVGLAVAAAFVYRQRRLADPLLDLRLFALPAISGTLALYLLAGGVLGGNGLLMTLHLQLVEGFSPLKTALWLLLPSALVVVGIQLSMGLAKQIRPGAVLVGGMLIAAVGMAILTQVEAVSGFLTLMIGLCVVFLGTSSAPVLSNQLVLQAAPQEKAGSAGSLATTSGELGTALGIAGLGSLTAVFYQGHVEVPAGAGPEAAAAANESISTAVAAARTLPPELGSELLMAARETFTSAYNTIAVVCAALFVMLAVIAWVTLRRVPAIGAQPPAAGEPGAAADPPEAEPQASSAK